MNELTTDVNKTVDSIVKKSWWLDYEQAKKDSHRFTLFINNKKINNEKTTVEKNGILNIYEDIEDEVLKLHFALNNHQEGLYSAANPILAEIREAIHKKKPNDSLTEEEASIFNPTNTNKISIDKVPYEENTYRYTFASIIPNTKEMLYSLSFTVQHNIRKGEIIHKDFTFAFGKIAKKLDLSEKPFNSAVKGKKRVCTSEKEKLYLLNLDPSKSNILYKADADKVTAIAILSKIQKNEVLTPNDKTFLTNFAKPYFSEQDKKRTYTLSSLEKADYTTQFLVMYESKNLGVNLYFHATTRTYSAHKSLLMAAFEAAIYHPKNKNMAENIIKALREKPTFFEVLFTTKKYHRHRIAKDSIRSLSEISLKKLIHQQATQADKDIIVSVKTGKAILPIESKKFQNPLKPSKTSAAKIYNNLPIFTQEYTQNHAQKQQNSLLSIPKAPDNPVNPTTTPLKDSSTISPQEGGGRPSFTT